MGLQLNILNNYEFDLLHVDIMDLNFVPNLALNFELTKDLIKYKIPKDIHLMVENVALALKKITVQKEDYISFHIETKKSINENIQTIRDMGAKPGLVISPNTPVDEIYSYLPLIDIVHVMTVQPGFEGQEFIKVSYDRVDGLLSKIKSFDINSILLGVDGGIGIEQIKRFSKLGVSVFVLGTTCLFNNQDFENQAKLLLDLKKSLNGEI